MIYMKLLKTRSVSLESEPAKTIKTFFNQTMNDEIDYCMNMLNDSLSDQSRSRDFPSIPGALPIPFGGHSGGSWRGGPTTPSLPDSPLDEEDKDKMDLVHDIAEEYKDLLVRIAKLIADDAEDYAKKFLDCHPYPPPMVSGALDGLVSGAKMGLDGLINTASGLANMATAILLENNKENICKKSAEEIVEWYTSQKDKLQELDSQVRKLERQYEEGARGAFTEYAKDNYNLPDPCEDAESRKEPNWKTITI